MGGSYFLDFFILYYNQALLVPAGIVTNNNLQFALLAIYSPH